MSFLARPRGRRFLPRNGLRDLNLTQSTAYIPAYTPFTPQSKHSDGSLEREAVAFAVQWPADTVPIEIFELITAYLTRSEVQFLRLVCREFEIKVSGRYFRNVVVPFKTELYSNLARDDNGALTRTSSALFSNGMRIFESFGCHILNFALSLELDEDVLAYPPIKPTQAAVPSFWGIYRWPHGEYHRYTDLEGLEQTADETEAMRHALECLSKVRNVGLCCDAGLGFLSGPDHIARNTRKRHPVFGASGRGPEQSRKRNVSSSMLEIKNLQESRPSPTFDNPMSFKHSILRKMVEDAGYTTDAEKNEAIQLMLRTEQTSLGAIDIDERRLVLNEYDPRRVWSTVAFAELEPFSQAASHPLIPSSLTRAQKEMLLELEWAHRAMIQSYVIGLIDNAWAGCFSNLTTLTIAKIPSSHVYILNRYELWQSLPSITHVTLGVIADWRRIHKPALGCIDDVPVSPVEAVGKVFTLLNDYIGRQENIESLHFEWICGGEFAPGTYQRNHYILPAPFVSVPQLMAMPDSPRTKADQFLQLPHVKSLSLKNCWFSPHVFLQCFRTLSLGSLEKLDLETVSLSGPPTTSPQVALQQHHGGHNTNHATNLLNLIQITQVPQAQGAGNGGHQFQVVLQPPGTGAANGFQATHLVPTDPATAAQTLQNLAQQLPAGHAPPQLLTQGTGSHPNQERLRQPRWLTWAGLIEHFSPSVKVRDILDDVPVSNNESDANTEDLQPELGISALSKFVPQTHKLEEDEKKYKLKSLTFKSCGYVSVDADYLDTRSILPGGAQGLTGNGNPHSHDLSMLMQRSRDKMLGRITQYLCGEELFQLVNAFGMDIGWATVYGQRTTIDAMADGVDGPGRGRFSGTIDRNGAAPPREPVMVEPLMPVDRDTEQAMALLAHLAGIEQDDDNNMDDVDFDLPDDVDQPPNNGPNYPPPPPINYPVTDPQQDLIMFGGGGSSVTLHV